MRTLGRRKGATGARPTMGLDSRKIDHDWQPVVLAASPIIHPVALLNGYHDDHCI